MSVFADWLDLHIMRPEVTGLIGSMLGVLNTPGAGWRQRVFNFGAGLGAAWFLAPAIEDYFNLNSTNARMAVAFVVGLVGMNLLAKVIDYVKNTPLAGLFKLKTPAREKRNPK